MLENVNMKREMDRVTNLPIQQGSVIYLPTAQKPSGLFIRNIPELIVWLYETAIATAVAM